jgi:hypothetical protein
MPINRLFAVLVGLAGLPYALVTHYYWTCGGCQISGDMLLVTYGLLIAAPFVLAGLGVAAVITSVFGLRRDLRRSRRIGGVIGAVVLLAGAGLLAKLLWWSANLERTPKLSRITPIHDGLWNGSLTVGHLRKFSERTSAARARP